MTITVSSVPVSRSVVLKPSAMDKSATSTPTTPAMPTMTTDEDPSRCGMVASPTLVTDQDCCPTRVSAIQAARSATAANIPHQGVSINSTTGITSATAIANTNPNFGSIP